jgi:hypothetical protein
MSQRFCRRCSEWINEPTPGTPDWKQFTHSLCPRCGRQLADSRPARRDKHKHSSAPPSFHSSSGATRPTSSGDRRPPASGAMGWPKAYTPQFPQSSKDRLSPAPRNAGGPPTRIERIRLFVEPPPGIDLGPGPGWYPPDFEEFILNADVALQMCGDLIAFVKKCGVPVPEVISWIGATDKNTYFSNLTSAVRWEIFYASRTPGIRYNLLVEYNEDWWIADLHRRLKL